MKLFKSLLLCAFLICPSLAQPHLSAAELERFDRYAEASRVAWDVPGMTYAIIVDGKVISSQAHGVRDRRTNQPVTLDTLFQAGSISKSFTSTLIGLLVDKGKLSWSDRVLDYYPQFQTYDPWVTREFRIDDTMSQRSGQPAYAADMLAFIGASRDDILKAMRYIEPVSSFRREFAYVNNMWLVAAKVAEVIEGKSWETLIQNQIFTPLGMTSSNTSPDGLYQAPNHAHPHQWDGKKTIPLPDNWPFRNWVYTYGPAGGVNTTIGDLSRYALAQMGELKLLTPQTLNVLHSAHTFIADNTKTAPTGFAEMAPTAYALGWIRQERKPHAIVWHNGGTSGFRAMVGFVPGTGVGFAYLSNTANSDLGEALLMRVYDLAFNLPDYDYSAAFLKAYRSHNHLAPTRPSTVRPSAALDRYQGTYTIPGFGQAKVSKVGNHLEVALGKALVLKLESWDSDKFSYRDPNNLAEHGGFVTFIPSETGDYDSFRLDLCSDINQGVFHRVKSK